MATNEWKHRRSNGESGSCSRTPYIARASFGTVQVLRRHRKDLVRIQGARHKLFVYVAATPHLHHVRRRRSERCVSNNDNLAEIVAIVGAGDVRSLDRFLASPADAFDGCVLGLQGPRKRTPRCERKKRGKRRLGPFATLPPPPPCTSSAHI